VIVDHRWFPKRNEVGVHLDSLSLNKSISGCLYLASPIHSIKKRIKIYLKTTT
jgi:hypothetical protein